MTNITACGLDPAGSQRKDTHPEQWLSGLGGLNRLADCRVGGQRSVVNDSGHNAVDLSPCNKHTWSGIAGSLTITSAQTPSQLHRDFAEDYAAQRVPYWQSYSGFGMLSMISRDVQWPCYSNRVSAGALVYHLQGDSEQDLQMQCCCWCGGWLHVS